MLKQATIVLAAFAISPAVLAQTQTNSAAPAATTEAAAMQPADFASRAAVSNLFELETSTMALERQLSAPVLEFAQHMIDDHTMAAQEMMPAAEAEGVEVPTDLDEAHQQQADELADLDDAAFEQAYVQAQVKAHEEAVALFSQYSASGPEGALKDFATKTLPKLEEHLTHVQELASGLTSQ